MTDYSNIEGLSEEEQIRLRKQMEAILGDQFSEEDSFREQARDALGENNIKNSVTVAAQASDLMLVDYMRLFYLQQEFEGVAAENIPNVIAYEMADLKCGLDLTQAPDAEATPDVYSGPTINISEGPATVTATGMADAYVEKFGSDLPDGPLDHTDTVVTQADLRDAIEKYESIEITSEEIEAYQQEQLESMIATRMDGIAEDHPEYEERLEQATEWANDMGMPRESFVVASLRHERFIEENPEMALSKEQAIDFAADGGPDASLAMRASNILSYYTDSGSAREMGMQNYASDRVDLRREIEATNQQSYEQEIAENLTELETITSDASGLALIAGGENGSNINLDTIQEKMAGMTSAFEEGDYNTAINAANEITVTAIGDIETRQIEAIDARFDKLQEAASEAGYNIETPEQMYELLNDEAAGTEFKQAMGNESTLARSFFSGEDGHPYDRLEDTKQQALGMQSEIENAAAKYEGIELEDVDPSAMTNQGVISAEAAAQPATDFDSMAKDIIDNFRGGDGTRLSGLLDATGQEFDYDRAILTGDILGEDFNAGTTLDIDNPEDLGAAMVAMEVYRTGEAPSAETIEKIQGSVDKAFDQDTGILDPANAPDAAISQLFQDAVASPASGGFKGLFRDVTEVGIPNGYDLRLDPNAEAGNDPNYDASNDPDHDAEQQDPRVHVPSMSMAP